MSLLVGIGSSYLRSRESQSIKAFLHSEVFRIQLSNSWVRHGKVDRSNQYQNVKTEPARFTQGMVLPVMDLTASIILGVFLRHAPSRLNMKIKTYASLLDINPMNADVRISFLIDLI